MADTSPARNSPLPVRLAHRLAQLGPGRNGVFALAQALIALVCGLLNYRLVVIHEGLAALGLWSLLMIFGGVASSFDFSGATSLARQVARQPTDFPEAGLPRVIHTVLLTALAMNGILAAVAFAVAPALIPMFVKGSDLALAMALLPWALAMMLVTPLAQGIAASIDGLMRADTRAKLMATAIVAGLAVSWLMIPGHGLVGLAMGLISQWLIVIAGGWLILRRAIPKLGWLPFLWNFEIFRQSTIYGLKIRFVGILAAMSDPLAKLFINDYGGPASVGTYELAARLIIQLRDLIFTSLNPYLPVFAALSPRDQKFSDELRRAQRYSIFASIVIALISLTAAPIICLVILSEVSQEVLHANTLLTLGWTANLMSQPFSIAAQGQNRLRWNMVSHATAALGLVVISWTIVLVVGPIAVVVGVAGGLILGALVALGCNAAAFRQGKVVREMLRPMLAGYAVICGLSAIAWVGAPSLAGAVNSFARNWLA